MSLLKSCHSYISKKQLNIVRDRFVKLEKIISKLPEKQVKGIVSQLADLKILYQSKNAELAAAYKPQLQQIIAKTQKLIGSKMPVPELKKQLLAIKQHWHKFDFFEGKQSYNAEYKTAFEQAYAPCAAFNTKLAAAKAKHSAKIQTLMQNIYALVKPIDFTKAEELELEQSLLEQLANLFEAGRSLWNQHELIDYKNLNPVLKEYKKLLDKMSPYLEKYQQSLAVEHINIIDKVKSLTELEINSHAIHQIKQLELAWRNAPKLPGAIYFKVLAQFKANLDNFYDKQRAKLAVERTKNNPTTAVLQQIIALENIVKTKDFSCYKQITEQFEQAFDHKNPRLLKFKKQFNGLCKKIDAAIASNDKQQAIKDLQAIASASQICANCEWQQIDKATATLKLTELDLKNKKLAKKFNQRIAEPMLADVAAFRHLCIKLELVTKQNSPSEDKNLRLQYQIQIMQQQATFALADTATNVKNLVFEWYAQPVIASEAKYKQLETRFFSNAPGFPKVILKKNEESKKP